MIKICITKVECRKKISKQVCHNKNDLAPTKYNRRKLELYKYDSYFSTLMDRLYSIINVHSIFYEIINKNSGTEIKYYLYNLSENKNVYFKKLEKILRPNNEKYKTFLLLYQVYT